MDRPNAGWWRELRRTASWHRRLLAAGLAATAVAVGLQVLQPDPPPSVDLLAAARDIEAGTTLQPGDVVVISLPVAVAPSGALPATTDVSGRAVAGPIRAGETITDVRLIGPALVAGLGDGLVAVPVRVADAATARLVRTGDRVDILGTPASLETAGQQSRVIASDVVVVAVPERTAPGWSTARCWCSPPPRPTLASSPPPP